MLGRLVSLGVLSAAALCLAQSDQPAISQPEITQHDAPASFSSSVNLVEVPVVVRDKQGHAIGNLTKDDFVLSDKGKPQIISRFAVEKAAEPFVPALKATDAAAPDAAAAPTAPVPDRFLAYMIDDVNISQADLLRVRQAVRLNIERTLDPVTRVAVVTTSGIGSLDFTDDLQKIHDALDRIQPNSRMPLPTDCPYISLYMADLIINAQDSMAQQLAQSDVQACGAASNSQDARGLVQATAIRALSIGESETARSLDSLAKLTGRMSALPGSRSVVIASPGFLIPGTDLGPALTQILDRAIRSKVVINSLDARGLYTFIPGGDASTPAANVATAGPKATYEMTAARAQQDILQDLATGTGGTFIHDDNGLPEGLDQLTRPPDYIYVLGYSPAALKYDGTYHAVKVTLRNPAGLSLQWRRGYYAPKKPANAEDAAKEDIREQVFSRDEIQDFPVDLRIQFFKSSPGEAHVTVVSRVGVKNLTFRKVADRSKDTLTVVAGLFDHNGSYVSGTQRVIEMNLRDQTLQRIENSGVTVRNDFDVIPGIYTVRIVVRDSEGQKLAARTGAVQIP